MALPPHEPAFQLSNPHANTGDPFDEGCENSVTRIRWPRLNEATALSAWRSKIDSGVLVVRGEEAVKLDKGVLHTEMQGDKTFGLT